jgi:DNA-binding XRE family transcriptional regulator
MTKIDSRSSTTPHSGLGPVPAVVRDPRHVFITLPPPLLKRLRLIEGLTQEELAKRSTIPYWRLIRLERGSARPKPSEISLLINALPTLRSVLEDREKYAPETK